MICDFLLPCSSFLDASFLKDSIGWFVCLEVTKKDEVSLHLSSRLIAFALILCRCIGPQIEDCIIEELPVARYLSESP